MKHIEKVTSNANFKARVSNSDLNTYVTESSPLAQNISAITKNKTIVFSGKTHREKLIVVSNKNEKK